jgi:hypothetical protein
LCGALNALSFSTKSIKQREFYLNFCQPLKLNSSELYFKGVETSCAVIKLFRVKRIEKEIVEYDFLFQILFILKISDKIQATKLKLPV